MGDREHEQPVFTLEQYEVIPDPWWTSIKNGTQDILKHHPSTTWLHRMVPLIAR